MGGANTWRGQITGEDWMRDMEKRVLHEERRPAISTASDLMGPGLGPFSVEVTDWNSATTVFNGMLHSLPGAYNSPDATRFWMGTNQATGDGSGLQRVSEYAGHTTDVAWPRFTYLRKFSTPVSGDDDLTERAISLNRVWSPWRIEDNTPPGMIGQYANTAIAPNGWRLCNGALLVRADYPDLFAVIGTTYNTGGEPADQFRIPTIAQRVIKV